MYEDDFYETSVEDDKYADSMFEEEHSTDDDPCDVFICEQDYSTNEHEKPWMLYSERALDTLCLCGLRNRLSHGNLEAKRHYNTLDGLSVILHRPTAQRKTSLRPI